MKRKRRKGLEEISGSWMTSYGDMITLLLCFFIMLFAMSTLDAQKWKALSESIKESFGASGMSLPDLEETPAEIFTKNPADEFENKMSEEQALQQLQDLKEEIDDIINEAGLAYAIHTEVELVGLVIRMCTDEILFDLGSAELKPMAISFLSSVSCVLREIANQVWVEGHADDIPVVYCFKYPSNWEVSTARASSVVRYLIDSGGIAPSRMKASGFADTKPRYPNDSDEHRYLNRRVEIVIKPLGDIEEVYIEWKKREIARSNDSGDVMAGESGKEVSRSED
jgi:chemotaxis protein MotB